MTDNSQNDKDKNKKINEQILQLNTDAGLANYNGEEPKRQFINGLTRQEEGKDDGGYDSAIKNFFGKGKNLYIQYKIPKKVDKQNSWTIDLVMPKTFTLTYNNSNGEQKTKKVYSSKNGAQRNNDQFRQLEALQALALKPDNEVIYATAIKNKGDFKELVKLGDSFNSIFVLDVKNITQDKPDSCVFFFHKSEIVLLLPSCKAVKQYTLQEFIEEKMQGNNTNNNNVFDYSENGFFSNIIKQFNSIESAISKEANDYKLYQSLKDSLGEFNSDIYEFRNKLLSAIEFINLYGKFSIFWVSKKGIFSADKVIDESARLYKEHHYKLEFEPEPEPDSKPELKPESESKPKHKKPRP